MISSAQRFANMSISTAMALVALYIGGAAALAQPQASEGESLILEAHAASKTAQSEEQLANVIQLCRDAAKKDLTQELIRYNNGLRSWAHNKRGEVRSAVGNHDAAYSDFEVAVGLGPNDWRTLKNRGASYVRRQQFDRALVDLNKALTLKPKLTGLYLHRADAWLGLHRYQKAIKDYDLYIDSRPDNAAAFAGRGHARFQLKKQKSGVADLYHALKLDPKNVAALVHRGEAFTQLGIYEKAARDFCSAIEIEPKSDRAYRGAAWLMATCPSAEVRNRKLAIEAAQKAIELARAPSYRHFDTLAAAQANDHQFDDAKRSMVQAMKLATNAQRAILAERLTYYQKNEPFRLSNKPKSTKTSRVAETVQGPSFR